METGCDEDEGGGLNNVECAMAEVEGIGAGNGVDVDAAGGTGGIGVKGC